MKIVLIGPVYPYKGGISHYTGMMYRALKKNNDVSMVSFKLQYPKLLFKKEQRDYENDTFKIEGTDYLINTANPLSWLASAKKINALKPDLVIIQWWHPYFAPCYWSIVRHLKKAKVLFLCHNVFPHERFPMDKWLSRNVLRQGDSFIVHSEQDAIDLQTIIADAKLEKTVLPTFNAFKFENMSCSEAREKLGIGMDKKVILFFGLVREYKGLKYLISAMPLLRKKFGELILLVAGDFVDDKEEYLKLIKDNNLGDIITIYDGYTPDHEVEKFFAACDLVALPYISATQSGIVQIAYGFNKPVVVTNVGGLPEVVLNGKTGYVVEPGNSLAIAEAVQKFFEENRAEEFAHNVKGEEYKYSWDRMSEVVERLWNK
ncbi:MAG: glycosyltransferase [Clostridia bacterium]|nr:glycosyltransferase [Clostridia bacterium]